MRCRWSARPLPSPGTGRARVPRVLGWALLLVAFGLAGRGLAETQTAAQRHLEVLGQAFRSAYLQAAPAVVLITTRHDGGGRRRAGLPPFHPEVPDEDQFDGMGSGTIVDPDGYILSNHHVVKGADSILVTLTDHRVFRAEVVGFDSLIDIALLRIQARGLPFLRLGDSDSLQIGDWVLAIGHPLGQGSTLTHGIVSAVGRQAQVLEDRYAIESFIQTDAVINPGNSGGPLLDAAGVVVGINTAITTRTGYYIGYGLAVPSNLALEAMQDILSHGRVVRGYLGVEMEEISQELNQRLGLGLERPLGVYLQQVLPGSPVARSGIRAGDVLVALAGRPVDRPNQVQAMIYNRDPGETVTLTVRRDGAEQTFSVVLGEREDDLLISRGRQRLERLGLSVASLSAEAAARLGFTRELAAGLGFPPGELPVVVAAVEPGGPAASRGLATDDLITEVDQQRIATPEQLTRALSVAAADQGALFWLWRPGQGVDLRVLRLSD
ncbi:MAG: trypsin-like peptidase domain-containing protein [Candidatus Latescibacterota bacterium]